MLLVVAACTSGYDGEAAPIADARRCEVGPSGGVRTRWWPSSRHGSAARVPPAGRAAVLPLSNPLLLQRPARRGGRHRGPSRPGRGSAGGLERRAHLDVPTPRGAPLAPPFEDTTIVALDLVERSSAWPGFGAPATLRLLLRGDPRVDDYASGEADSIVGTRDARRPDARRPTRADDRRPRLPIRCPPPRADPEGAADGHDKDYTGFLVASGAVHDRGAPRSSTHSGPTRGAGARERVGSRRGSTSMAVESRRLARAGQEPILGPARRDAASGVRGSHRDHRGWWSGDEIARRVDEGSLDLVYIAGSPFEQVAVYEEDPSSTIACSGTWITSCTR